LQIQAAHTALFQRLCDSCATPRPTEFHQFVCAKQALIAAHPPAADAAKSDKPMIGVVNSSNRCAIHFYLHQPDIHYPDLALSLPVFIYSPLLRNFLSSP
jgi:hypothetical protein